MTCEVGVSLQIDECCERLGHLALRFEQLPVGGAERALVGHQIELLQNRVAMLCDGLGSMPTEEQAPALAAA